MSPPTTWRVSFLLPLSLTPPTTAIPPLRTAVMQPQPSNSRQPPPLITSGLVTSTDHELESPISDSGVPGGTGLLSKSRNARAQARHRAKRKAYIEQLEANVSSLTETLNDLRQRGAHEPSSMRYLALEAENRQLRQENAQLRHENSQFRDQLADAVRSTPPRLPIHPAPNAPFDEFAIQRDGGIKRRKRSADESYLASASVSLFSTSMASQTPGAFRGEASGSCIAPQMAAGDAHMSHPHYDNQHPPSNPALNSIGDYNSPHQSPSDYHHPSQLPFHSYRSSMAPMSPSSAVPHAYLPQKAVAEPGYSLQYPNAQSNPNAVTVPRHYGPADPLLPPSESQRRRQSSGTSLDHNHDLAVGTTVVAPSQSTPGWPTMYTSHAESQQTGPAGEDGPPVAVLVNGGEANVQFPHQRSMTLQPHHPSLHQHQQQISHLPQAASITPFPAQMLVPDVRSMHLFQLPTTA
ncbi:hypothetical protein DL93DRAFT_2092669 [Clavulina sp. PMI_390]|nr:hypothetical protein DL93DRAFT_2092669 [Clavulina sp. PMI_390]